MAAGQVTVNGALAAKPARLVDPADSVELLGPPPRFVGRGGDKLAFALERFGISASGRRALDAGASTGGFTDCLLQAGAESVVAVDVGHGQLHPRLRAHPRVVAAERTDIRSVDRATFGGGFDIVVADLSFISLRLVLAGLVPLASGVDSDIVVLVKPQFEAGRAEVSRGRGVITDPAIRRRVIDEVSAAATEAGAFGVGLARSPVTGRDGNVEFFLHLRPLAP